MTSVVFNRTMLYDNIYVTKIKYVCIKFKIRAFFITPMTQFGLCDLSFYLTCGKHLYHRIISLRGVGYWSIILQCSLTTPLTSKEIRVITKLPNSEQWKWAIIYMFVRVLILRLSTILGLDCGPVPTVCHFLVFLLLWVCLIISEILYKS